MIDDGRLQIHISLKSKDPENMFLKTGKKLPSDVKGTSLAVINTLESHSLCKVLENMLDTRDHEGQASSSMGSIQGGLCPFYLQSPCFLESRARICFPSSSESSLGNSPVPVHSNSGDIATIVTEGAGFNIGLCLFVFNFY